MSDRKLHPLNMRTTREMRAQLEAAATASGRSLTREVEHRLELSFHRESIVQEIAEEVRRQEALERELGQEEGRP